MPCRLSAPVKALLQLSSTVQEILPNARVQIRKRSLLVSPDNSLVLDQDYLNLKIASDRNSDDIASFVKAETQDLIKRRKLLRFSSIKGELEETIINQVTQGANGM